MDLVELYLDRRFKFGDTVYHKPSGMVGKYRMDQWVDKHVSIEIIGQDKLLLTEPRHLTHKLPRFAKLKHIYKYAPKRILICVYLVAAVMLISCAVTANWHYSLPGGLSFLAIALVIMSDRAKKFIFPRPALMIAYGIYCLLLAIVAIRYDILYK